MSDAPEEHWCITCFAKLDSTLKACASCGREFSSSDPSTYYCRPVGFLTELDLHVVYLTIMMSLLGLFLPWPFVGATICFLIPQPMILTSFIDGLHHKPDERKLNNRRIIVNEACVAFVVTIACIVNLCI